MLILRHQRILGLVGAILLGLTPATAQVRDDVWARELSQGALFHVEVIGKLKDGGEERRIGKAFAIGSDQLITVKHIVGDAGEWAAKAAEIPEEVFKVLKPIDRALHVTKIKDYQVPSPELSQPTSETVVLSPGAEGIDAVGVAVPDITIEKPFRLSLCGISKGNTYAAIMTRESPDRAQSLSEPIPVPLLANGYDPVQYGGLYVFELQGPPKFSTQHEGHQGSPILNEEDQVVAIVSAVTLGPNNQLRILATPITPLVPPASLLLAQAPESAPRDNAGVKCSLSQTVRRIHDRVAAQAFWSVDVARDSKGRIGRVAVTYESVAEQPSITAVKLFFEFHGTEHGFQDDITRISDPREDPDFTVLEMQGQDRRFETDDIGEIGRNLIEPDIQGDGGSISFVKLYIFPKVSDQVSLAMLDQLGYLKVPIVRKLQWIGAQ